MKKANFAGRRGSSLLQNDSSSIIEGMSGLSLVSGSSAASNAMTRESNSHVRESSIISSRDPSVATTFLSSPGRGSNDQLEAPASARGGKISLWLPSNANQNVNKQESKEEDASDDDDVRFANTFSLGERFADEMQSARRGATRGGINRREGPLFDDRGHSDSESSRKSERCFL